ncbi:NAD(P)-dependent oxidoreductase [Patescibacteria group bacterium]|nr:NAD(P)-dependent oxidoreductase [Patescibacteria group bacterium]
MINKDFWLKRKILIIGSNGFVGTALLNFLKKMSCNVTTFSREKDESHLNYKKLNIAMSDTDIVINCAALDGNSEFKKKNSALILSENIDISSNILRIAQANKVEKIVLFSSAEIYSDAVAAPFAEGDDYNKFPDLNRDGYVLSKIFTEILAKKYEDDFGMNILILRPTNIFGPNDKKNGIIPTIYKKINENQELLIWGDGRQNRNFIFIEDLVNVIYKLIEVDAKGIFNVGSAEVLNINQLIDLMKKVLKKNCLVKYDKSINSKNRNINTDKLSKFVNYKYTPIETALKRIFYEKRT